MEKPTLQGEMIVLRPIRASDADALWESLNDAEGNRLTGTTQVFTREEIDAVVRDDRGAGRAATTSP